MKKQIFMVLILSSASCYSQDNYNVQKSYNPPSDLKCALDGCTLHRSWLCPLSVTEEWILFHDGSFEDAPA